METPVDDRGLDGLAKTADTLDATYSAQGLTRPLTWSDCITDGKTSTNPLIMYLNDARKITKLVWMLIFFYISIG